MTNPPTPPADVPPMPKADRVVEMADYFVDDGCSTFRCWKQSEDGTTTIERYAAEGWAKFQQERAENERLRESLETLRPKVLQHDPEYNGQRTNGPMPKWNGMLKMIDNALAARKEKECE